MRKIVHDAVADAVRRKYPTLTVTEARLTVDPWKIKIEGGTKAERDAAMAYVKQFAEGGCTSRGPHSDVSNPPRLALGA
jgi:hypothetical protein